MQIIFIAYNTFVLFNHAVNLYRPYCTCIECRFKFVSVKTSKYKTIHEAVKNADVESLAAMVKDGASVNELQDNKDRFTPVHWACYKGALEVCSSCVIIF